jgi:hypothetical protein
VGYSSGFSVGEPRRLAERYHDGQWSIVTTPGPSGVTLFYGITCSGPAFCLAVGQGPNTVLIDRWNGSSWAMQSAPAPAGSYLRDAACLSPSNCFAVGGIGTNAATENALAEHWNGTSWSRQHLPATPTGYSDRLLSVVCVTASDCTAVGARVPTGGGLDTVLVEHWNGASWSRRAAPSVSGRDSTLAGIGCIAANNCFAVGSSNGTGPGSTTRRLAEHWNGSGWSVVNTPAPGTETGFDDISCAGAQCVVVGFTDQQPLVDRWDGAQWHTESVTQLANRGSFAGVHCVSVSTCVAVGADFEGNTVVERRG